MDRVVITGSSSSGKTYFSKELGKILKISDQNIYHLDQYFWRTGWIKTSDRERIQILSTLVKSDRWIIEGNFPDTLDFQLSFADTIIFLNISPFICFYRILVRYVSYILSGIPEISNGLRDRINFKYLFSPLLFPFFDGKKILEKIDLKLGAIRFIKLSTTNDMERFLLEEKNKI